jgi:GntR family transcriptional repressor for pyruvate dehydrogenase complex
MIADNKAYLKVIRYIRQQLVCGQLSMGSKLPTERELSEMLGLSRNSIREALRTMENMGIVASRQGSGNYLTGNIEKSFTDSLSMMVLMKQVDYIEMSQLRRGIEMQSLLLAMKRITDDELRRIGEILTKMEHSQKNEEAALDKEFHYAIVAASGNELMMDVMQALSTACEQMIEHVLKYNLDGNKQLLMESHRRIYESLLHKDLNLGVASVTAHYDIIDNGLKTDRGL